MSHRTTMTKLLEWGKTRRRKASAKVIFFLHCTSLAQLSSYVIVGAYNFSRCNHAAIIKDYQNVVQAHILNITADSPKNSTINCCPQKADQDAMLTCISNFTQKYIGPQYSEIRESTVALLTKNCHGYSPPPNNGSQDIQVNFKDTRLCRRQREIKPYGNSIIWELRKMWDSYLRV